MWSMASSIPETSLIAISRPRYSLAQSRRETRLIFIDAGACAETSESAWRTHRAGPGRSGTFAGRGLGAFCGRSGVSGDLHTLGRGASGLATSWPAAVAVAAHAPK